MAEEKVDARETNFREWLPWTELFRGFQVALDPKKLLLAAAGIVVMAIGWQLLGAIFHRDPPKEDDFQAITWVNKGHSQEEAKQLAFREYQDAKAKWDLNDKASSYDTGTLRTWPWTENRGPNPFLLATGQARTTDGTRSVPWEQGQFIDWFLTQQVPYLIEPLIKFFLPVIYLMQGKAASGWNAVYFLLVIVYTLAVWAVFGGAITRMAAVQVARNEKISLMEAIRFVLARYASFLSAPLFPLAFVAVMVVFMMLFGVVQMIPVFGDIIVDGLFWFLPLLGGLAMTVVLVGLVGWPMMSATISAEGSDSFDAISRSYSYVYQSPWNYVWNCLVAVGYGAVVVFFVGFMGSMVVYLAEWGVSRGTNEARDPAFLFVKAPESFNWRGLLLKDATVNGQNVVVNGQIQPKVYEQYVGELRWYNWIGAVMVAIWLHLFFLMILGFGYSYFWSASTIIYLLMRRKVDDTDFDEVYLEEDEAEEAYSAGKPGAVPPPPQTAAPPSGMSMVEAPTLRPAAPPLPPTPAPAPPPPVARTEPTATAVVRTEMAPPPNGGDGNSPAAGEKS